MTSKEEFTAILSNQLMTLEMLKLILVEVSEISGAKNNPHYEKLFKSLDKITESNLQIIKIYEG